MKSLMLFGIALFIFLGECIGRKIPADRRFIVGCIWGTAMMTLALWVVFCN
jgi:hypothetical protein